MLSAYQRLNVAAATSSASLLTSACTSSAQQQQRGLGRRMPKQGKPPILPPAKKVLYHVVHVPWQKPEDVKELLWRRHVYNNAVTSLREVFRAELQQNAAIGKGIESMKEAEEKELEELISENERRNKEKAAARAAREEAASRETKLTMLNEIEETLLKQKEAKRKSEQEVQAAIERSAHFVTKDNLETKVLAALENPVVYDFAIDKMGNKFPNPMPVKYQEGTPTRQKGRLYDETLGSKITATVIENTAEKSESSETERANV
ncbi:unnamed protein product [Caenorhabditis auriculariae]|uniref:Small ribosomal subunit protein mS26 n=1 Tax=Caenorhabditis auriculariae TaxID=2777116 RepID=A0A8S1H6L3_9PELO|nr:unnamed protein product [Caenorhabditis auriculariae]